MRGEDGGGIGGDRKRAARNDVVVPGGVGVARVEDGVQGRGAGHEDVVYPADAVGVRAAEVSEGGDRIAERRLL